MDSEYANIVSNLTEPELSLLRQSHDAFVETHQTDDAMQEREAAAVNGDVVSESESDNPDDYISNDKKGSPEDPCNSSQVLYRAREAGSSETLPTEKSK